MKKSIITILTLLVLNIALYAVSTTAQGATPQCVGIGTTTPTAALDVQGDAKVSGITTSGFLTVQPQDLLLTTSTGIEGGQIDLKASTGTGQKSWSIDNYNGMVRFFVPSDTNPVKLQIMPSSGALELGSDATDATPYIDFRSRGTPDFNARIINEKDNTLKIVGNLEVTGNISGTGAGGVTKGFIEVTACGPSGTPGATYLCGYHHPVTFDPATSLSFCTAYFVCSDSTCPAPGGSGTIPAGTKYLASCAVDVTSALGAIIFRIETAKGFESYKFSPAYKVKIGYVVI